MTAHTPGPWSVVRRRDGLAISPARLLLLGECDDRAVADTALAAAAPELLILLERHLAWLDGTLLPALGEEAALIAAARAAVAKARGHAP